MDKEEQERILCKEMVERLPKEQMKNIKKYLFKIWRKYNKLEDLNYE